jgi:hypothetical protein
MLSIGDFARHGRVSVRMLRHYDAIGLLRPARVDAATGVPLLSGRATRRLRQVEARLCSIEIEGREPMADVQIQPLPAVRVAELTGPAASYGPDGWVVIGSTRELYLAASPDCTAEATVLRQPVVRGR